MDYYIAFGSILLSGIVSFVLARCTFSNEIKKQIDQYDRERKLHYSKVKYDTEFQTFKELSQKSFTTTILVNQLIQSGEALVEINDQVVDANNAAIESLDCLYENAPFISHDFNIKIGEHLNNCNRIIHEIIASLESDNGLSSSQVKKFQDANITDKWVSIVEDIRGYIEKIGE
jgi:hypothetical protein